MVVQAAVLWLSSWEGLSIEESQGTGVDRNIHLEVTTDEELARHDDGYVGYEIGERLRRKESLEREWIGTECGRLKEMEGHVPRIGRRLSSQASKSHHDITS
jgi:hypothetical protein